MIVSLKWMRDYVDISLPVEELANRLTMVGLEVEGVHQISPVSKYLVAARLKSVEPHPQADQLRLCIVADNCKEYRVVCGAPNLEVGSMVVLALPGAELAGGLVLRETTIRGQVSQGMLCSQMELGLGTDGHGIWVLPESTPVGLPIAEFLGKDDVTLELGITPNRGDCLSIVGVAREVAAICDTRLRYPQLAVAEAGPDIRSLSSVIIDDPVGCPRYAARLVQGVKITTSPDWLRERVEAVGIRSINNIVDVTNFIMMELGQPLHAFDFDRLREHRIVVRRARRGERFSTLDGVERELFDDTLMICDGGGPVAIAGIMGGLDSEITEGTGRVLIEAAYFQPQSIRRSCKKLGLRTESSFRFERGVDPEGLIRSLDRAAQLMMEVGGGDIAGGRLDVYPDPVNRPVLQLRVERTNRFLGTRLTAGEMANVLRRIEMQVAELDSDRLEVVPPPFRPDVTREVDLAEEVVRLVGYDKVPVTAPVATTEAASFDPHLRARRELKYSLQGAGFMEVLTYSFISDDLIEKLRLSEGDRGPAPVRLLNPLSEEQAVMRTSLLPGLLQTARFNFDRGNDDLRIFELSKVFLSRPGAILPEERHHLVGLMAGARRPGLLYGDHAVVDFSDIKGVTELILNFFYLVDCSFSPEQLPSYFDQSMAAAIVGNGCRLGTLGRVAPEVEEAFDLKKPAYIFEFDFDDLFAARSARPLFRPLPKFPSVVRDMAIVVDEDVTVQEPLDYILSRREPLLEQVEVFDIFKSRQLGEDKRSIGYRLVYRSDSRNLTDEEVNDVHSQLAKRVLDKFDATLR